MTNTTCPEESAILEARRRDAFGPEHRAHLAECSSCRDAAAADAWLGAERQRLVAAARPVAAPLVWRAARERQRAATARRALRVLSGCRRAAVLLVAAAAAAFVAADWAAVRASLVDLSPSFAAPAAEASPDAASLLLAAASAAVALLAYGLYSTWAEE